jgi:hypothetical protein
MKPLLHAMIVAASMVSANANEARATCLTEIRDFANGCDKLLDPKIAVNLDARIDGFIRRIIGRFRLNIKYGETAVSDIGDAVRSSGGDYNACLKSILAVGAQLCAAQQVEAIKTRKSDPVYVESGGTTNNNSAQCDEQIATACVSTSDSGKRLNPRLAKLHVIARAGRVYLNGGPVGNNPVGTHNIGWYLQPGKASSSEVCALVFARTSACIIKVYLRAELLVPEE